MINKAWAEKNKDFVTKLIATIAKQDAAYRANKAAWTAASDEVKAVARIVGSKPEDVPAAMGATTSSTPRSRPPTPGSAAARRAASPRP